MTPVRTSPSDRAMIDFQSKFAAALGYDAFLERHGTPEQRRRWADNLDRVHLTDGQRTQLATFRRDMNVLCLAGAWCGDCATQCPIFEQFARACPRVHLRLVDRDSDAELARELRTCGGFRVPVAVFLSEDFAECCRYGDRTISRYRAMSAELAGTACPTGLVDSPGELAGVVDDWLREFERVQLMLRLSPRLRGLHGD